MRKIWVKLKPSMRCEYFISGSVEPCGKAEPVKSSLSPTWPAAEAASAEGGVDGQVAVGSDRLDEERLARSACCGRCRWAGSACDSTVPTEIVVAPEA